MINEVLQSIETGVLAQISLLAFLIAFILVLFRVFSMSKKARIEAKQMPLNDLEETMPFRAEH